MMSLTPPASSSFYPSALDWVKQKLASTIVRVSEVIHDDSAYQKICLLALAIIRGINYYCCTNYLPRLMSVLDTAAALDFFGFCRLPRLFFYPYTPAALDEEDLLDQLELALCQNFGLGVVDQKGMMRDHQVRDFAKGQLIAFLEKMTEDGMDFEDEEEVKAILHRWYVQVLEDQPILHFDPNTIDFQSLDVKLKKSSRLNSIMQGLFIAVDLACIPSFFQAWGFIDLKPVSLQIGRVPFLSWAAEQVLDDWIWKLFCAGNFMQALLCLRSLWDGKLSSDEVRAAKWLTVASLGESIYSLSILSDRSAPLINAFAFAAKFFGLIAVLVTPKPTFFQ